MLAGRCTLRHAICFVLLCLPTVTFAGAHGSPFGAKPPRRADTVLVVHAGTLLVDAAKAPLRDQTVIVRNESVDAVIAGFVDPAPLDFPDAAVEVLDLRDSFVMPGMFDAHVHLSRGTGSYQSGSGGAPPVAEATVNAVVAARLNLAAGFTTVRDLGSDSGSVFAVRDAINRGHLLGPTILASGPSISVTAGHGDDAAGSDPDARARAGVCDGADECRTLVRHLEKIGSDVIKLKVTGGFSSNTGLLQHMTPAEMNAIVEAAHLRGLRVTAHAYDPGAILDAINAGVDSIEHGFLVNDDGLRAMRKGGVFLVPTVTIAEPPSVARRFLGGREPASVTLRNEARALERAYEQGVKIAFGTDCGIYPHGENADELQRMVELGMTEADALRSATTVAAELFGIVGRNGRIVAGDRADIIAVSGNPLADIAAMKDVTWVIKDGRVAKRAGVVQPALDYSLPQKY